MTDAAHHPGDPAAPRGTGTARRQVDRLLQEAAKFGVVGVVAFVADVGIYNALRLGTYDNRPTTAKIISSLVAMAIAYVGNRFWTYRNRPRTGYARETALFFVFNLIGIAIALACQAFTHYVLGLTSLLDDNLSANGIGLVLGTLFRFWSYRRFVFPRVPTEVLLEDGPLTSAS